MKISVFASDCTDAHVVKRMRQFQDHGWSVVGVTFRKLRYNRSYTPEWPNLDLGYVRDRAYFSRAVTIVRALVRVWRNRNRFDQSRIFFAMNLDSLALAIFAQTFLPKVVLAYEVADISPALIRRSAFGSIWRAVERLLLKKVDLLVVTSPAYIHHYFQPLQSYESDWHLLENRIFPPPPKAIPNAPSDIQPLGEADKRWTVGYFGLFRCRRSWEIIKTLARELPDKVSFRVGGYPAIMDLEAFTREIDAIPNISYIGEYNNPDDLPALYSSVDISWGFDFSRDNDNSRWCLTNRLYEGGFYEVPILVSHGFEMSEFVEKHSIGWTISEPYLENLSDFFRSLTCADYRSKKGQYRHLSKHLFAGNDQFVEMCGLLSRKATQVD